MIPFEKFTEQARMALSRAQELLARLRHNALDVEHLLLVLLGQGEGLVAEGLARLEFDRRPALLRLQDDLNAALRLVDTSGVVLEDVACNFCPLTYALAAGSVCARAGDAVRAEGFLERAERCAGLWAPGVWTPALCELRGEVLQARGSTDEAAITLRRALEGYAASGQGLNERRVRETIAALAG